MTLPNCSCFSAGAQWAGSNEGYSLNEKLIYGEFFGLVGADAQSGIPIWPIVLASNLANCPLLKNLTESISGPPRCLRPTRGYCDEEALPLAVLAVTLPFPSAAAATTVRCPMGHGHTFGTTMTDSSGNGNDGTMSNIVTSGAGYIFDGGTSKVVVPDSPSSLNPGSADFSFSVQVQTSVVPAIGKDYDLIRKGNVGTRGGEYKIEMIRASGKGEGPVPGEGTRLNTPRPSMAAGR